jgi:thioesterase domain-containing protein
MASVYLNEIKRVQPYGPYYIGGYCFGGLVAYEIANQLIEQGETVQKLFLISTSTPKQLINKENQYNGYRRSMYSITYRIKSEIDELSTLNFAEKIGYLKENYFRFANLIKFKAEDVTSSILKKMNLKLLAHSRTYYLRKSIQEFNKSYLNYEPKPIDIDFLLIPVAKRSNLLPDEDHLGWENMSRRRLHIQDVDSYHRNVMKEPYVKNVASILNDYFQRGSTNSLLN